MELVDRYDYEGRLEAKQTARQEVGGQINKKCMEWGQTESEYYSEDSYIY